MHLRKRRWEKCKISLRNRIETNRPFKFQVNVEYIYGLCLRGILKDFCSSLIIAVKITELKHRGKEDETHRVIVCEFDFHTWRQRRRRQQQHRTDAAAIQAIGISVIPFPSREKQNETKTLHYRFGQSEAIDNVLYRIAVEEA